VKHLTRPLRRRMLVGFVLLFSLGFGLLRSRLSAAPEPADGVLRRLRLPVLMYHYIGVPPANADKFRLDLTVTPDRFREQLRWLKDNGYRTLTAEQFVDALMLGTALPERAVLLTFDDGYSDAYSNAFPILREFGFVGTFFVVTDWIDQARAGYLTWSQVQEMDAAGMSIQSHSRDHLDMRERDFDWYVYHVAATYATLEAHVGAQIRVFCYPAGRYDQNAIVALRALGVTAAFTTEDGTFHTSDVNMLRLPRVRVRGSHTVANFAYLVEWVR